MSKISVVAAPEGRSSILSTTNLDTPDFRWVGLKKLAWQDPMGKSREWECAFRTTRRSECDGVAVVAFVRYPVSGKEDEVVLVSQYRPPVGAEVIEAPAGLVDAGEDAKTAAERELLEETGFSGRVTCVSPIVPCDPGMTDANMRFVTIEVDGDAEENRDPKARLEDGEFITLRRLPARSMQEGLDAFAAAGFQVDARLYAMAVGYTLGRREASGNSGSNGFRSSNSSNVVQRGGGSGGGGGVGKGFHKTWALWALCLLSPVIVVASVAGRKRMGCPR